jgi:hypothetical protein
MNAALWSPVLLSLIFWAFVLGISILPGYLKYRERKLLHETARAIIAQGGTVSPEMLETLKGRVRSRDDDGQGMPLGSKATNIGIIILGAAGGVAAFGALLAGAMWYNHFYTGATMAGPIIVGAGLLVGAIGVAFLFIGIRTRNQADKAA